jgi:lysylphosphatidylglycerol synthetase-like protein (DUF2156 family)
MHGMNEDSNFIAKRATGAMFFSLFGSVFFIVGQLRGYGYHPFPIILIIAVTLSIFGAALYLFNQNKYALKDEADSPEQKKNDKVFHLINAGQWVVILICGNILANIGLSSWIIPMAICIIGLHFLPLARLFQYAPHYITGSVLIVWGIFYPFVLPNVATNPFGCFVPGIILWSSAIYALFARPNEP